MELLQLQYLPSSARKAVANCYPYKQIVCTAAGCKVETALYPNFISYIIYSDSTFVSFPEKTSFIMNFH